MIKDKKSMENKRILWIQYFRGLAALFVVIGHIGLSIWIQPEVVTAYTLLPVPVHNNTPTFVSFLKAAPFFSVIGVALFFLISGFVIPMSLKRLTKTQFIILRIFRIWPTLIICTLISIGVLLVNSNISENDFPHQIFGILTHVTLTRDIFWQPYIDNVIWTLEIEIKFYIFCALASNWIIQYTPKVLILALVLGGLAIVAGQNSDLLFHWNFNFFAIIIALATFFQFLCFMLMGTAFYWHWEALISTKKLIMIVFLLLIFYIIIWRLGYYREQSLSSITNYAIALVVFILGYSFSEKIAKTRGLTHELLNGLGEISYPLYLVHTIMGLSIVQLGLMLGYKPQICVLFSFFVVIFVSFLIHKFVETPGRSYGKKLLFGGHSAS